jgi:hypothetical protein
VAKQECHEKDERAHDDGVKPKEGFAKHVQLQHFSRSLRENVWCPIPIERLISPHFVFICGHA